MLIRKNRLISFLTTSLIVIHTGSVINFAHGTGTCLLLAAGNTPINCSNGRNCKKKTLLDQIGYANTYTFCKFSLTGTVSFSNSVERPPILIKSLANGA